MFDINSIQFDERGLVPAIAADADTNEVLMQAYMNREAIEKTLETGRAHYYSRSRKKLWLKGETSGHFQDVVEICSDCDNDSILMRVRQTGAACHTGAKSCFFNNVQSLSDYGNIAILQTNIDVIKARAENPEEGSYTNYLLGKGIEKICKKLGEESSEVIIAAMKRDKAELSEEFADLFYHALVLMQAEDLSFNEVLKTLEKRHASERKRIYKS